MNHYQRTRNQERWVGDEVSDEQTAFKEYPPPRRCHQKGVFHPQIQVSGRGPEDLSTVLLLLKVGSRLRHADLPCWKVLRRLMRDGVFRPCALVM